MMNERGKSDRPRVPGKSLNKAEQPAEEEMEGRGLTKGTSATAKRVPDSEPARRARRAEADTSSSN
jgi:hypothetical protein